MQIATIDIGGTHARFALADVNAGRVVDMAEPVILRVAEHAGLSDAWRAFGKALASPLPRFAALGVAGPVTGGPVYFVNSPWVVDPATLGDELGLEAFTLVNDFGAMAHAVDALGADQFDHLCGPDKPLPSRGAISVIGPGTGLGVAVLQRRDAGSVVLETEGSHIHFAPLDARERAVCDALTARCGRASVERVVSGPGLSEIVRSLAPEDSRDDAALWASAIAGDDPLAAEALEIFLGVFGSAAGDLSLAHGSLGVAIVGGLSNRIASQIRTSNFHERFCDKGRYRERMESIPVKLITHPQPGLFGAAAAFAKEHAA